MKGFTSTRATNKENGPAQTIRPRRMPLSDITNEVEFLRRSLENDTSVTRSANVERDSSAPRTRRVRTGTAGKKTMMAGGHEATPIRRLGVAAENAHSSDESSLENEPLLAPPTARTFGAPRQSQNTAAVAFPTAPAASATSVNTLSNQFSKLSADVASDRLPWSTLQVPPKTHKTTSGQVVILPSHSTLVDFREGERRKGKKGDEVIVVSADGLTIQVFSAPHLSTPCCLAEPTATYTLSALPVPYYKLYDLARKVIERIKKRIPKLVMYETDSTCTLMNNGPVADIVVNLDAPSQSTSSAPAVPSVRVSLSRKLLTCEISTSTGTEARGGEWSRKVLFWRGRQEGVGADELRRLGLRERKAMKTLMDFLPVVDSVEAQRSDAPTVIDHRPRGSKRPRQPSTLSTGPSSTARETVARGLPRPRKGSTVPVSTSAPNAAPAASRVADTPSTGSLASLSISPRPKLGLGASPAKTAATTRKASSTVVERSPSSAVPRQWEFAAKSGDFTNEDPLDMRFLPEVGWCIRFGAGAGTYRIMFLDGAVLEVGVNDERVTFAPRDGSAMKSNVRECHAQRDVGERMKVFEEFVSMFDADDAE
ncbi:hypothetical protein PENSPDRAFT_758680 [Peniophora sp. CONT]|nr:hypothetical protein PENSPDRAFT_758680 [Peniophora sp. CONT]